MSERKQSWSVLRIIWGKTGAPSDMKNPAGHAAFDPLLDTCMIDTLERKVAERRFLKWMNNRNNRDTKRLELLLNYIRVHRKNAGISQNELGHALGYQEADTVARHERFENTPPLEIAIAYAIVFRVPIAQMFAGLHADVELRVESNLAELEEQLGRRNIQDGSAHATARKLMWLGGRRENNT